MDQENATRKLREYFRRQRPKVGLSSRSVVN